MQPWCDHRAEERSDARGNECCDEDPLVAAAALDRQREQEGECALGRPDGGNGRGGAPNVDRVSRRGSRCSPRRVSTTPVVIRAARKAAPTNTTAAATGSHFTPTQAIMIPPIEAPIPPAIVPVRAR